MGLNVGEVNATLTATDNMSPQMQLAAARVADLQARLMELEKAGESNSTAYGVLAARMAVTQQNMQQLGNTSVITGQSMAQIEGIALRLVERLALLYAVRGTFQFVEGLFEAADALVHTSQQLDVTIADLYTLQQFAEQADVPWNRTTNAIDSFNKKLAENKLTTHDALEEIGLSFAQVMSLNPQDRFYEVATAIGSMGDKTQRTAAEVKLFGTDAIDPLMLKLAQTPILTDAAKQSIIDTQTDLAAVVGAYKQEWIGFKEIAAEALAWTIDAAAAAAKAVADADPGAAEMASMYPDQAPVDTDPSNPKGKGPQKDYDIHLNPDNPNALATTGPDEDYIDKMKDATAGEKELTEEQVRQMSVLKELNLLTADNAAKLTQDGVNLDINTAQYKKFTEGMSELAKADKAAEAYEQSWERAEKQTADLWAKDEAALDAHNKANLANIDALNKNQMQRDLTFNDQMHAAGLTSDKQYADNKSAIEFQYFQQHQQSLRQQEADDEAVAQNTTNKELAELEVRYAEGKVDSTQYEEQYSAITEAGEAKRATIRDKYQTQATIARRAQQDQISNATVAFDSMNKSVMGISSTFDGWNAAIMGTTDSMKGASMATAAFSGDINSQAKTVLTLAGAWITAADAKKQFDQGNSMTYDLSTDLGIQVFEKANPGATISWGDKQIEDYVKGGGSLQTLVQAGIINLYGKLAQEFGQVQKPVGFADGGTVDIMTGERGPEVMRVPLGTQVAPHGTGFGGGGGGGMVQVNLTGLLLTNDPSSKAVLAKVIIDALTPVIRLQRKVPGF